MAARLRFTLPTTVPDAERLHSRLKRERRRIEQQLDDPCRPVQADMMNDYDEWRARAQRALRHVIDEMRKTENWLALNKPTLLERAYELLRTLEEEVDFEPDETALVRELEHHCRKKEKVA